MQLFKEKIRSRITSQHIIKACQMKCTDENNSLIFQHGKRKKRWKGGLQIKRDLKKMSEERKKRTSKAKL